MFEDIRTAGAKSDGKETERRKTNRCVPAGAVITCGLQSFEEVSNLLTNVVSFICKLGN
jgi:hypothetical protein